MNAAHANAPYHGVVESTTLPGRPVGTVMSVHQALDTDPEVFVIWHPDRAAGHEGGRTCKLRHLVDRPDLVDAFGLDEPIQWTDVTTGESGVAS